MKLDPYSARSIIKKKRDGAELSRPEIAWFMEHMTAGEVSDSQVTALLMAIFINGMNYQETADLTDIMLESGKRYDFNDLSVIDKHSTGGVGDKTSFILAPLAVACGVKVPMISGRGLGHTGGTVDKMESIPGFSSSVSWSEFEQRLIENGIVMTGQTEDIAPADRKIYSLRDVTSTIESIPLITASIMSKKLAEGASGYVMDIKVGEGAFLQDPAKAKELIISMQNTAKRFKKNMVTMMTDMSQPLGNAVGNSLEIIESIEVLKGKGPKDLTELSLQLAGAMVFLAGKAESIEDGVVQCQKVLASGEALKKFELMLTSQGGDKNCLEDYSLFPMAKCKLSVKAKTSGFVSKLNSRKIGFACVDLGGGRHFPDEKIDFGVGFIFHKRMGDKVKAGDILVDIYHNESQSELAADIAEKFLSDYYEFSATEVILTPLIQEVETVFHSELKA